MLSCCTVQGHFAVVYNPHDDILTSYKLLPQLASTDDHCVSLNTLACKPVISNHAFPSTSTSQYPFISSVQLLSVV